MRIIVLISAVWSLIAAPALCRAGALTACCTHDSTPSAQPICCNAERAAPAHDPPPPAPAERKCDACALVCGGAVAKPDETGVAAARADPLPPCSSAALPAYAPACIASARSALNRTVCDLPFPPSDVPRRI